jgi:hypothetical protein
MEIVQRRDLRPRRPGRRKPRHYSPAPPGHRRGVPAPQLTKRPAVGPHFHIRFRRLDRAVVGSLMAGLVQLVGGRLDVSSVDALCWIAVPNPFERLGQGLGYGRTINVCGVTGKDELVMITLRG